MAVDIYTVDWETMGPKLVGTITLDQGGHAVLPAALEQLDDLGDPAQGQAFLATVLKRIRGDYLWSAPHLAGQKAYDPNEARDEHGRWTSEGEATADSPQTLPAMAAMPQGSPLSLDDQGTGIMEKANEAFVTAGLNTIAPDFASMAGNGTLADFTNNSNDLLSSNPAGFTSLPQAVQNTLFSSDVEDVLHQKMDAALSEKAQVSSEAIGHLISTWNANPAAGVPQGVEQRVAEMVGLPPVVDPNDPLGSEFHIAGANNYLGDASGYGQDVDQTPPLDRYIRAQYEQTQQYYSDHPELTTVVNGERCVPLARGVRFNDKNIPADWKSIESETTATMYQDALSSWSTDPFMAKTFAAGDGSGMHSYVVTGYVPVSRIFSNGVTGMGVAHEGEHLVIDGGMRVTVKPL